MQKYGLNNNWFTTETTHLSNELNTSDNKNNYVQVRAHQRRMPCTCSNQINNNTSSCNSNLLEKAIKNLEKIKSKVDIYTSTTEKNVDILNNKKNKLESAQKEFNKAVIDMKKSEEEKEEGLRMLNIIQNETDRLSLIVQRENIENQKKLIQSVYDTQMANLATADSLLE